MKMGEFRQGVGSDLALNSPIPHLCDYFVSIEAIIQQHRIGLICVAYTSPGFRQPDTLDSRKKRIIYRCFRSTHLDDVGHLTKLHEADPSQYVAELAVGPPEHEFPVLIHTKLLVHAYVPSPVVVVRNDHSPLAGSDDLPRMKTETGDVRLLPDLFPVYLNTHASRRILDHDKIMFPLKLLDRPHIQSVAEQGNRHDTFRPPGDRLFDLGGGYLSRAEVHVNENHGPANILHRLGGGGICEIRDYHLVTRPDADHPKCDLEGSSAVRGGNGIFRSDISSKPFLEFMGSGPLGHVTGIKDLLDDIEFLGADKGFHQRYLS